MKTKLLITSLGFAALLASRPLASGFCGFYVAKADTKLFNKASQVVLVRDHDKTVLTMANDYEGDPKEFAVVVPVPTVIKKEHVRVMDKALMDHLDAYSAPRLVEYFDDDPCEMRMLEMAPATRRRDTFGYAKEEHSKALGVKIEEKFTVGEYDILILSAQESNGLETWLVENGYKIPKGASEVLGSYIKQNNKFFVAKVNLEEQSRSGFTYLRPLQVSFSSRKFMLPIRLGTVNANGPQELFIYALTRKGRVETTNYRTVKLPSDVELPLFIEKDFAHFYRDMFKRAVAREDMRTIFTEYAWDMGWCDPCAAEPLSNEELRKLGVDWLKDRNGDARPGAQQVFITRLHLRYDAEHFPEDLVFQETGDTENFQGRYIMRHFWRGKADCNAAKKYLAEIPKKLDEQAKNLAKLTGWDIDEIREKIKSQPPDTKRRTE